MLAALSLLAQAEPKGTGRRIAILGDMLELGPSELELHSALLEPLLAAKASRVFLAGPRMRALWEALPESLRGIRAEDACDLLPLLLAEIRPGDVLLVKGSNGSRMGPLVEAVIAALPEADGS